MMYYLSYYILPIVCVALVVFDTLEIAITINMLKKNIRNERIIEKLTHELEKRKSEL